MYGAHLSCGQTQQRIVGSRFAGFVVPSKALGHYLSQRSEVLLFSGRAPLRPDVLVCMKRWTVDCNGRGNVEGTNGEFID
jgi:hypothetical protein